MKRFLLSIGLSLVLLCISYGQTTLSAGDIAIAIFNGDGSDDFYFVLLKDISTSTEIIFTDNGWLPESGSFRDTEGQVTWTSSSALSKGTVVKIFSPGSSPTTNYGTVSESEGGFTITVSSGDQIIAFQGTLASPTPIYMFDNSTNGLETTDAAVTGTDDSGLPTGLTAGTNAYIHGSHSSDNYQYSCPSLSDATSANILVSFMNSANYNADNTNAYSALNCSFTDVTATGSAGWRLLSLPKTGGTITDISDDTPVQGVTGGDDSGSTANFIIYDNDASFEQPTNVSTAWGDGYGFGLYFYNNSTNGSSTLPVTLDASGAEPSSDVAITLNPAASGYTLVGNPFASNFNTNNLISSVASIQNTIHFWNGSSYVGQDRTASSGYIIAPWQGFWVQKDATANAATLTFPTSGKTTSSSTGTFFKTTNQRGDINFTLLSESTVDEDLRIAFRANATFDYDIDDSGKLTPLLPAYATMAFESNDMLKSVESLPYNLEEEISLSLQPQIVGVSGQFTFGWNGLETIPGEWELILHDYDTGENIDMRATSEYVFTAGAQAKANPNPLSLLSGPAAVAMKAKAEANRFGITIRPTSVSNETEDSPAAFALEQNYPNPFNPSTTISYSVQKAGAVTISVYNLMGQKVATLVDETKAAGQYNVRWNAAGAASGMYYYRLEAGGQSITRKMTLIK